MLSYDWLKILGTIAVAVVAFLVLFTMIATRVTQAQTFEIYAYYGVSAGADYNSLQTELSAKGVFSYDVLKISSETFSKSDSYSSAVFTARRSAGQGTVMFVSSYAAADEEGNRGVSELDNLVASGVVGAGDSLRQGLLRDPQAFMGDCESYLKGFFGDNLEGNAEPDMEKVRQCFLDRNGSDKRFRSAAKKEAGVLSEKERIVALREDYLTVRAAFDEGVFSYTSCEYTYGEDKTATFTVGVNLGGLKTVNNLFYYTAEDKTQLKDELNLVIFNNGEKKGMSDLKYETVSFLRYLLEKYNV